MNNLRIGQGIDAHAFIKDRTLILGGVHIPHAMGLAGHSDADVLTHAICDALLGAAALGDIGKHFPDNDAQYCGIDSQLLLQHCMQLLRNNNWQLVNIDATVIAQTPRLATHIPNMRNILAASMMVKAELINIKATTTEYMGFTGRKEGIAAMAVVLLHSPTK
ncbi:MAG: 2-C-methyl-D-erythritol 2,4-cyclodiphosphate synthase [Mariprofundales bacterium]